ncbi:Ubiquinone biosynthesis O-methyltransferase, mitochondrial [subsurface metagenome]
METVKEYWEKATPMSFSLEKWSYEQKRNFRYELQDYMHKAFRFQEFNGKKVLEIGCGSGIDAIEFAKAGALVTATDITDSAVELTKSLANEAGVEVRVIKVPADKMPYRDNSFDCVYSYGVLHHILDVDSVLKEAHRLLKPNGVIMAMLYHRDSLLYAYSIIHLHKYDVTLPLINDSKLVSRYSERIEDCPYTKAYTKIEAKELFEQYFKDIKVSVHYNVIDTPQQRKVKLGISDKYELGWHLIIKGVKTQ